jgi:diguanylate cyclase
MSTPSGSGPPVPVLGVQVGSRRGLVLHRGLVWLMWLVLAAEFSGMALPNVGWGLAVERWFRSGGNDWLGMLADLLPVMVCWLVVWRVGFRRIEVPLTAAALTVWASDDIYGDWVQAATGSAPNHWVADLLNPLFYLLLLAAVIVAAGRHAQGLAASVWMDCAVGSLGACTVLAVVLRPVFDSALSGSAVVNYATAAANPLFDLVLVSVVAGIAAVRDVRSSSRWALLIAGLMIFASVDTFYALQVAQNNLLIGKALDAGWAVGLAVMAVWAGGVGPDDGSATQETKLVTGAGTLIVSLVATLAGLAVLSVSSRVHLSTLAVALAVVTLLVAVARSQLAFRQVALMANLRKLAAATDELTGLPNRRALYAEGQTRLAQSQCSRQALLMLDLDKFKEVNDSLGHHAGDLLLIQVGARLDQTLRAGDRLARLGGDEFAVLLADAGRDEAIDVAVKLCSALAEPFTLNDISLHSGASIGIALFPDHGPDLSTLLRKADIAMYQAKTSGSGHQVYSSADDGVIATRMQTVEELRTALRTDQLVVYYQPKIDLDTGEVHSVEALVRWEHPIRGLLYPESFLDLVEEFGLMPTLTRVVLDQALDQAAEWHAQGRQLTVAVNLSASSLVDSDLPRQVASMLAARNLLPGALQLEITEEFLMADPDRARSILTQLRGTGIQISVDDYGTGYSSLSYLRDLPIDELKLDRSFIFPMADDVRAAALVASTIALAHGLGLRMVAEGVETHVAYTELAALGCDQAQGYFISRPVPAAELDYLLRNRRSANKLTDSPPITGLG